VISGRASGHTINWHRSPLTVSKPRWEVLDTLILRQYFHNVVVGVECLGLGLGLTVTVLVPSLSVGSNGMLVYREVDIDLCLCQENPQTSRCLGVFGLSLYTQERDLRDVFEHYGPVEEVQVVYDHQSGRSRGFAFIYMRNHDDAVEVTYCCNTSLITDQSRKRRVS